MKRLIFIILIFLGILNVLSAASYTSKGGGLGTGNWTANGIWSGAAAPPTTINAATVIVIKSGDVVTLNLLLDIQKDVTITIEDNATLKLNLGLNAAKALTINVSTLGNLIVNTNLVSAKDAVVNINGKATVNGNIDVAKDGSFGVNGELVVNGDFTSPSGTVVSGTGSLIVTGIVSAGVTIAGTISYSSTALPIELAYFNVELTNSNTFQFDWETKSERNNEKFIIQYATDASIWLDMQTIAGQGNSSVSVSYSQTATLNIDTDICYFRLKQVDFDGKTSYSSLQSVNMNALKSNVTFEIYPNPTSDIVTFKTEGVNINVVSIFCVANGVKKIIENIDSQSLMLNVSDYISGMYIVEIQTTSQTEIKQLLIR